MRHVTLHCRSELNQNFDRLRGGVLVATLMLGRDKL